MISSKGSSTTRYACQMDAAVPGLLWRGGREAKGPGLMTTQHG